MKVSELFKTMCEMSFIERGMFERLGRTDTKTIQRTSNPFVQVCLFKNVSYFTNLESALRFIDLELKTIGNLYGLVASKKVLNEEQKEVSLVLFGTVSADAVHVTSKDSERLRKVSVALRKY